MLADFKFIIFWWLNLFLLSLITLPFVVSIFRNFWDKGYAFAKIFSLIIITYLLFVFGVLKLITFTSFGIYGLLAILILISLLYLSRPKNMAAFKKIIQKDWPKFLFQEIIFLTILILWSYVRGFQPDIEGLEKFMDWGFINSMLRTKYFPPVDMWFSGHSINYYYFGHLIFAFLTKLSSISSIITYNLAIATTCALTFTSVFSLTSNLVKQISSKINLKQVILAGFISALLVTFGGNLHLIYKITRNFIADQPSLVINKETITQAVSRYWYPDATRFIGFDPDTQDKTIHEFPAYSYVVSDLHGHLNDIAIVLLYVAFLFTFYQNIFSRKSAKPKFNPLLIIFSGFNLSLAFMTNAWDFAVYGLLFAISFFIINLSRYDFLTTLKQTLIHGISIIIFWYLFTLPFMLNFTPMAEGLRFSDSQTPFYQLLVLYGGFWLITVPFIIFIFYQIRKKTFNKNIADLFVIALIITATFLIIIPEIGYIKDIYISDYRRANTMFKLVYQAFILYGLTAGYIYIRLKKYNLYKFIFILVFISHLSYIFFATNSYYGSLKNYQGLYGLNFLKTNYPDNYQAIKWIDENISDQPVMLEAVGDSYTQFNQISISTGLPTVQGWVVHEWLWRGGYDQPSARQADVKKIYQYDQIDLSGLRDLIYKYNISYIFVGDNEIQAYPEINQQNFLDLGAKIVFSSGDTKIYQLP